jgi:hypothetical protein
MGAYEDEIRSLEEDLANGLIDIKEYNHRLKEIEWELTDEGK